MPLWFCLECGDECAVVRDGGAYLSDCCDSRFVDENDDDYTNAEIKKILGGE